MGLSESSFAGRSRVGPCSDSGFTLLELIVIIVILGSVLLVAMPRIPMPGAFSFASEVRRTATLLRYIEDVSGYTKDYYRVSFYLDDEVITVERSGDGENFAPPGDPSLAGIELSLDTELMDIVLQEHGVVDEGSVSLVFNPTFGAVPFKLHLRDSGGDDVLTLTYSPYSGRVKVIEGYV